MFINSCPSSVYIYIKFKRGSIEGTYSSKNVDFVDLARVRVYIREEF